jgi:molybdopterin molybdotransferase
MSDDFKGKSSLAPFNIQQIVSCMDGYDPDALRVDKACEAIRACLTPITGIERVATRSALGRVLAEDIVPGIDVPSHDNSAMDGYALRAADLASDGETVLKEAGTALAGKKFQGALGAGECVRVMTGAVMPPGADTVVIQEIVKSVGGKVVVPAGQKKGQNVRYAGEDLKTGVPVLHAGHAIRPAEIGLIASLGIAEVMVKRRLRVAFFSTGDELASIGSALGEGQVYDSNRYTLYGMLQRLGVEILDMGVIKDDRVLLENALRTAAKNADVIITSGGVSVGEADFIKAMMAKLGEVLFWRIAMRPGRPMAFGRIASEGQSAFLFGLPGNPVAVMVTFHQFVRDALLFLAGRTGDCSIPLLRVPSAAALRKVPGRTEYQRGVLSNAGGVWSVRLTGQQGSGVLRSMSEANCFIVLEHDRGNIDAGDLVGVQLFEGLT